MRGPPIYLFKNWAFFDLSLNKTLLTGLTAIFENAYKLGIITRANKMFRHYGRLSDFLMTFFLITPISMGYATQYL